MNNWINYFNKHKNRKPKTQFLRALEFCKNRNYALDLGAGNLIESKYMEDFGFKEITAVDSNFSIALPLIKQTGSAINLVNSLFNDFNFPVEKYDFINAEFSLPFNGKEGFQALWDRISNSLRRGGIFSGQLFGNNDSWSLDHEDLVFHTKIEVEKLINKDLFEVLEYKEEEYDRSSTVEEMKHWHIFRFILKKK